MAYIIPQTDLHEALKLHGENRDGPAFRCLSDAIRRDRGEVHPCVIDWLSLSAEAGRKKSWAAALGFKLNTEKADKLSRGVAQNFFSTLRKNEGRLPTMEAIVSLGGMVALRELGIGNKSLATLLPDRSTLQRYISESDGAN